jgi:halocyanin-like protein
MSTDADMGRRTFLRTSAGAAAATAAVAAGSANAAAQGDIDYGGWFEDVSNYDGTTVDATGQSTVTVEVGTEGNNGNFAYSPPAVLVDPGTTVVFEWTGEGGQHNVVEDGGGYESELFQEAGVHYAVQFEGEGISKYLCSPHRSLGMKGAVAVGSGEGQATGTAVEPPSGQGSTGNATTGNATTGNATTGNVTGNATQGEGADGGGGGAGLAGDPLVLFGVAVVLAFLSPVLFAVVLSLVYRDE